MKTALWMSSDEYFDARRTITSSPRSYHSTVAPGVSPSLRRMRAGIETWPWEVSFDSVGFMYAPMHDLLEHRRIQ